MKETILFNVYSDFLVWPISKTLTWRRQSLWPILQPATRGAMQFSFCHRHAVVEIPEDKVVDTQIVILNLDFFTSHYIDSS